ncbi:MAG: SCO family protein [Deltaproteobacteria bacterium]|nr:SCO family protein [Deltaproteobacteria bacterium]
MTTRAVTSALLLLAMLLAAPGSAWAQINVLPPELADVTVVEHLGAQVPTDVTFRDHEGRAVRLGQYFDGRRPVLLNLVYHRCPMLCSMVLNAVLRVLAQTRWSVGQEFDVVTLSIDPRDTTEVSAQKRQRVLRTYNRTTAARGWHFLTGDEASIRRVTEAVGFQYRYDARQGQYAHPAVTTLLTPSGRVGRYLYGIEYREADLRLGLLEASEGRSVTTVERLILYCYHYDPQGKRYALLATRVMRLGGAVTVVLMAGLLGTLWLRDRRRKEPQPADADTAPRITGQGLG